MDEIERKVDMLISGIVLPQKRTRRRVATIVATVLIAMTLIASASLITYYYQQTGTVEVECAIWITPPDGTPQETPFEDSVTIGTDPKFYPGDEYISGTYTAENTGNVEATLYIHVEVTETLSNSDPGDGEGLTVEVHDSAGATLQIILTSGGSETFTIHVTANAAIDHTSTYGYTLTLEPDGT